MSKSYVHVDADPFAESLKQREHCLRVNLINFTMSHHVLQRPAGSYDFSIFV